MILWGHVKKTNNNVAQSVWICNFLWKQKLCSMDFKIAGRSCRHEFFFDLGVLVVVFFVMLILLFFAEELVFGFTVLSFPVVCIEADYCNQRQNKTHELEHLKFHVQQGNRCCFHRSGWWCVLHTWSFLPSSRAGKRVAWPWCHSAMHNGQWQLCWLNWARHLQKPSNTF